MRNVLEAEDCGMKGSEPVLGAQFGASRDGEGRSQCIRVITFQAPIWDRVSTLGVHCRVGLCGAGTNKGSQDLRRRTSRDILEPLASGLLPTNAGAPLIPPQPQWRLHSAGNFSQCPHPLYAREALLGHVSELYQERYP